MVSALLLGPAENFADLCREGEWVEGLEEDSGYAEIGKPALIDTLHLGREQNLRECRRLLVSAA